MNQALVEACEEGNFDQALDLLTQLLQRRKECELLLKQCGVITSHIETTTSAILPIDIILKHACAGGNQKIVKLICQNNVNNWNYGLFSACQKGHLHIIKYLFNTFQHDIKTLKHPHSNILDVALRHACEFGDMACVQFLLQWGVDNYAAAFVSACKNGNIQLIDYFIQTFQIQNWNEAMKVACQHQHLHVVEHIIQHGNPSLDVALAFAAAHNYFDVVDILVKNGANLFGLGFSCAIHNGHFQMATFFLQKDHVTILRRIEKFGWHKKIGDSKDVIDLCMSFQDIDWNFQSGIKNLAYKTRLMIWKSAFRHNKQNISLAASEIYYFLNRNINRNQLASNSIRHAQFAECRRCFKQRLVQKIMLCVDHVNVKLVIKCIMSSQISYE